LIGQATQYVALRRDLFIALGGFDLSSDALGNYAVLIDFVERALDAGYVVGHRDTAGLKPLMSKRMKRHHQREGRRARAALLARHARSLGRGMGGVWWLRYGLAPAVHQLWAGARGRGLGRVGALRSLWAFAAGTLAGLRIADTATRGGQPASDRALIDRAAAGIRIP
jgi:hypothetical protein